MNVGLAISTTEGRGFLEQSLHGWNAAEFPVHRIWVNVDTERRGVAWNKNRGLKAMMDAGVEHMFLADDDIHPLFPMSWMRYVQASEPHLMLSWGPSRMLSMGADYSTWSWPRGVLLYVHRDVVKRVGGMRTDFRNGHEHVEWSRRIHQAGFTQHPYADIAQDVPQWFHCEDMRRPGESHATLGHRRKKISTMRRSSADTRHNEKLFKKLDGNTDFVDYR